MNPTTNQTTPVPDTRPGPRVTRGRAVLVVLIAGGLALLASTQTWLVATDIEALPDTAVESTGQQAAGAVTAMALVAMAGGIALSIAGRIARLIIGVLLAASAVLLGASTLGVMANPVDAAQPRVAELSGLTEEAGHVTMTWAPWLALVGSVLMLVAAVVVVVNGRHWQTTRKYDKESVVAPAASGSDGPVESDPDAVLRPEAVTTPSRQDRPDAERRAQSRIEEIDAWDDLSQGKDPT